MRKLHGLVALSFGAACALISVLVVAAIQSSPDDGYEPYGISRAEATALVDAKKRRLWEEDLAIHQTAEAGTPPPRPTPYDPPDETPFPEPTGFVEDLSPSTTMSYTNAWYGEIHGQRVEVLAGYGRYDARNGTLVVRFVGGETFADSIPGSGPLRIESINTGSALISARLSGETFVFDFAAFALSSPTPAVNPGTVAPIQPPTTPVAGETSAIP